MKNSEPLITSTPYTAPESDVSPPMTVMRKIVMLLKIP
jgi:hypothetical protein